DVPPVFVLGITDNRIGFDSEIGFDCSGTLIKMRLRGVIYGGQGHFTCRFFDRTGCMWFHDGITTGRQCIQEDDLIHVPDLFSLHTCKGKNAVAVVYAKID
ncbi:hypothetical protein B0H17DRAFT_953120, partial [Mycena rosella]